MWKPWTWRTELALVGLALVLALTLALDGRLAHGREGNNVELIRVCKMGMDVRYY